LREHGTREAQAAEPALAAFRFRNGTRADLPHCLMLLPEAAQLDAAMRRRVPEIWGQILARVAKTFAIIEDLEQRHPANIEAFGLSVFVTDRFTDEFCASPRPYLPRLFYERVLAGEDIVLTEEQLSAANSTARLNVLVLHFGLRNEDLADPRTVQALAAGGAAFYFFHGGYRIKSIINEVYGAQAAGFMQAGGFRLVRDFQREMPAAFAHLPAQHHPYLFALRRDWVEPGAVNPLSQLFAASQPRIFFSAAERRLLERALLNESDLAIAAGLAISHDAVKKTWQNIFVRTGRQARFLLPHRDESPLGRRGPEKRRHLLEYLRTHLEEVRPGSAIEPVE
jgi:DNA-binding CsgD family transcriptional regulator